MKISMKYKVARFLRRNPRKALLLFVISFYLICLILLSSFELGQVLEQQANTENESEPNRPRLHHAKKKQGQFNRHCDWFLQNEKSGSGHIETFDLIEKLPFEKNTCLLTEDHCHSLSGLWQVWRQWRDRSGNGFPKCLEWMMQTRHTGKLQIIVAPHSHNDPGWLNTFEDYFRWQTLPILNTVIESLRHNPERKFIWAETSYLSLWWKQASEAMRTELKRLILDTQQLEIVTGGWVMNDEANTHYFAIIEQMVSGHEWLRQNLNETFRPVHGWAIDPFGHSPTMAYLLNRMGFQAMVIQRVHYHLKKFMGDLEFNWRQSWPTSGRDTSIFCHMMPFKSYSIEYSCGPDPEVCCLFDFSKVGRSCGIWPSPN